MQSIAQHTLYQITKLSDQIEERRYIERRILSDSFRAAQHADRNQYDRFLETLRPVKRVSKQKNKSSEIPNGLIYREQ